MAGKEQGTWKGKRYSRHLSSVPSRSAKRLKPARSTEYKKASYWEHIRNTLGTHRGAQNG